MANKPFAASSRLEGWESWEKRQVEKRLGRSLT